MYSKIPYRRYKPMLSKSNSSVQSKLNYLLKQNRISKSRALANRNFCQYGKNAQSMSQTTVVQRITATSVGTGLATRIDFNITLSSLYYRYFITSADTTNVCRVLIIQAKGHWPAGSPVDADIFRSASSGGTLGYEMPVNTESWYVLADHAICFTTSNDAVQMVENTIKKFPEKNLKYSSTGTQDGTSGDIFVVTCSDSGAVSHPVISGYAKLKYYE